VRVAESEPVTSVDVEHICDLAIQLDTTQVFTTPLGTRITCVITGGLVQGPRLNGEVLPGGGDWVLVGADSVARVDVRATIRTDDQELIFLTVTGRVRLSPDVLAKLNNGGVIGGDDTYLRTAPLFETGAEAYHWLNSTVAIGLNELSREHITYRVYGVK
jgi:hypothetical protein